MRSFAYSETKRSDEEEPVGQAEGCNGKEDSMSCTIEHPDADGVSSEKEQVYMRVLYDTREKHNYMFDRYAEDKLKIS